MKSSRILGIINISILVILSGLFNSCKDNCQREVTYIKKVPVYLSFESLRESVKPEQPRQISQTGKILLDPSDNFLYVVEPFKGVHVIENSNPSAPEMISFITIPGVVDVHKKDNFLYADSYVDLVSIDVSNPYEPVEASRIKDIFPYRVYIEGIYSVNTANGVVVDYIEEEVTEVVDCDYHSLEYDNTSFSTRGESVANIGIPGGSAIGGSMARFTIVNDYLYVVSEDELFTINVSNPGNPAKSGSSRIGFDIETIYPFQDKLFIGSTTGMYIYDIEGTNKVAPRKMSEFQHVRSCDPVVADENYAYVTLRSGSRCMGGQNQLLILDINNLNSPSLIGTYQLTNPHGLALYRDVYTEENRLFICDGTAGLKEFDASTPDAAFKGPVTRATGFSPYDIIIHPFKGYAVITAQEGIYQYDISETGSLSRLSKIPFADPTE